MAIPLLATKTAIPPLPHQPVQRDRLLNALKRGVSQHKLILVSAAVGYGKTTLLTQWASRTGQVVAWLTLDERDNDVERFFCYLFAVWKKVQLYVADSQLSTLVGAMAPDSEAVLSAFINLGDEISEPTIFVLDDLHAIEEPAIFDCLTFLLDHLPPTMGIAIATRVEPTLPALRKAEPEGYVRLFADLGLSMGRLLQEARSRHVMTNYVDTLLDAFKESAFASPEQQLLPEPLTDREVQVLELIAASLTNREVADELVISPLTVKKHATNIYGKLGVSSRMEAAARARELALLELPCQLSLTFVDGFRIETFGRSKQVYHDQ